MAAFEKDLTQLETVVERLERGELTLDESVRLFEEGMKLRRRAGMSWTGQRDVFRY